MVYDGKYTISFSKVPGKVMENEVTIQSDGKGGFTGFLTNISGDNPITGTLTEDGAFAFAFAGGHRHAEQEGHPPAGGPGGPDHGPGGPGGPGHGPGGPGGPGHGPGGPGEVLVMNFAGKIHADGTLDGTLTVMEDVTPIQGKKI